MTTIPDPADDPDLTAPHAPSVLQTIRAALRARTTLTLGYSDAEGPQACAVLFALAPSGALVFVTSPGTRHGRALSAAVPVPVAFTAQADGQEWSGLTGVQGRGHCRRLPDGSPERAAAWSAYTERFPFVTQDDRLAAALAATALWELRPDWLRLIDNGRGFGWKQEWNRPLRDGEEIGGLPPGIA